MTKRERQERAWLYERMSKLGFSREETDKLRRIERTLQHWGELECGTGDGNRTVSVERDEETGKPFRRVQFRSHSGRWIDRRSHINDYEKGALKRLARIMASRPHLTAYHQGDCRGCNLYILRPEDLLSGHDINSIYTRGLAVC